MKRFQRSSTAAYRGRHARLHCYRYWQYCLRVGGSKTRTVVEQSRWAVVHIHTVANLHELRTLGARRAHAARVARPLCCNVNGILSRISAPAGACDQQCASRRRWPPPYISCPGQTGFCGPPVRGLADAFARRRFDIHQVYTLITTKQQSKQQGGAAVTSTVAWSLPRFESTAASSSAPRPRTPAPAR